MTERPPDSGGVGGPDPPPVRRLGALLGAVVAPTTLVTALLYYFGWHHAYWFFDYFGLNSTVLGLSTTDYLMRSLDALFVPMAVTAAVGLLAFWGHDLVRARLSAGARPRVFRVLLPVTAGVGFLLASGGLWSVLAPTFLSGHLVAAPLSLALGVLLLAYVLHLHRTSAARERPASPDPSAASAPRAEWALVAEWAVVFTLVGLSLFWAANDYAAAVGRGRAREFVAQMPGYATAVVHSERGLSIGAPGVREIRCGSPESAFGYRYEGLVLVLQSANSYVLLPRTWTDTAGVALVLPRTDAIRLEFVPHSARGTLGRATC